MNAQNKLCSENRVDMKKEIQQYICENGAAEFKFRGIFFNDDKVFFTLKIQGNNKIKLKVLSVNDDSQHPNILEYQNIISDAYLKKEPNKIFKPHDIMSNEELSWIQTY